MRILIAGVGGLVGSAVASHLASQGHAIVRLVRRTPVAGEVRWDPETGAIDAADIEDFDSVVHVASAAWPMRWTATAKQQIRANRLATNSLLAGALAICKRKPLVLVCASGMGIYPPSGEQIITEESAVGTSFLAHLQRDGEAATAPASVAGIRVVHLRIPPVLAKAGIQRGTNRIGSGRQWMSWVARDELAGIVEHVLVTDTLVGPVNPVSPNPVRNADFAAIVARVLGRKPGPTMPAFLMHLLLGEMADEFLLASRRMEPRKLLATGYQFRFSELEAALRHELKA
ncbi:MAG: TIGR01777 family oxidoreductase [Chloroflexi bacterium]|nr:TIGR01777 family oxidoreductase [Chloroflexota bacterium]